MYVYVSTSVLLWITMHYACSLTIYEVDDGIGKTDMPTCEIGPQSQLLCGWTLAYIFNVPAAICAYILCESCRLGIDIFTHLRMMFCIYDVYSQSTHKPYIRSHTARQQAARWSQANSTSNFIIIHQKLLLNSRHIQ